MSIVIAGGTGLLGTALVRALRARGRTVNVLTRRPARPGDVAWDPRGENRPWMSVLDGADAVVNLAGASIAGGRWTRARKHAILQSRLDATRALAGAINGARRPPPVFISSSAVGYYGVRGGDSATENTPPGSDFLGSVGRAWEEAAHHAQTTRLVLLRTGVVLAREGGALPQLALPFRMFVGGPVGTGRQFISWIHIADWVAMAMWALDTASVAGPLNATAPEPVTNAEFARTLGRVLRRPSFMPTPAFVLRTVLGEMADALILGGQRVVPAAPLRQGFAFQYPTLEAALREIYPQPAGANGQ